MSRRFNLLADPRFTPLQQALQERVKAAADALEADTFPDLFDPVMMGVFTSALAAATAHEGTIWLADTEGQNLVPVVNTGRNAEGFVGTYRQPLSRGIISMVYVTEQPFCENQVYANQEQDKTLDRTLSVVTCSMIAVPFYFARQLRGIVSCVQLKAADDPEDPPGFDIASIRHVQMAAVVLSRLLDHRLVGISVGWEAE